ncbi:adenylosuccinate lyase [Pontibacter sp. G13]|uniref:adenylosuccinate lyase n=1 Tax=Pontibacter sp. G13 TaxID=3074898 RepID=UPI00288AA588|nr:adenylosuccinate lyase [Pontibacter sp. G13]WNJ16682.1 adenylosuccinate lyase [Pontibacter sp. G13]
MELNSLTAISPLDGRYRAKLAPLGHFFSEYALIRYRIRIEVEYLIDLFDQGVKPLSPLSDAERAFLRSLYEEFSEADAARVKEIERTTNHDVKAIEYIIKEKIDASGHDKLIQLKEFVHFGLTSQDINNTATPLMMKEGIEEQYLPRIREIIAELDTFAAEWLNIPMLARTHGQPASPTTLGKEIAVFAARLRRQVNELAELPYPAKFGGATGNLNAHYIAYPTHDWQGFAKSFVEGTLGLERTYPTTQIEHYDGLARIFDCLKRINSILIDLCQDVWIYISQEYFRQKVKAGEVGSSAMPHKVNPIDFENGEGNCGLSTALLEFLSRKLPVSRLQRDLTDSTILRNVGAAVGYAYLAQGSILKGLGKLLVNENAIARDLNANWAVLAEAIQTILRREGFANPYEMLRDLTRGNASVTAESLAAFVDNLEVSDAIKAELKALSPQQYVGSATQL